MDNAHAGFGGGPTEKCRQRQLAGGLAYYIVSWELSQNMGQSFVMEATRAALSRATPHIWNSDQGSHFTSPQYTSLLEEAGVRISMDGRGRFVDNIFTERLWRTINYEGAPVKGLSASEIAPNNLAS